VEDVLADGQLVFGVFAVGKIRAELRQQVIELDQNKVPARGRRTG
jgi:hypothetical protein